jgi:uncharacterized membrane protein YbaN (DUF454 family)
MFCITNTGLQKQVARFKTRKGLPCKAKQVAIRKITVGRYGGIIVHYQLTAS